MNTELNLLPFNLEEALKNPERVVYRNGEKPLEWHWFKSADQSKDCIVNLDKDLDINTNKINGSFGELMGSRYDLMLLPLPEKRYWVNVFKHFGGELHLSRVLYSENDANQSKVCTPNNHYTFIKTISFTI